MFLLTGCAERTNLEDLGLQTAIGFDLQNDGKVLGTSVLHHFKYLGKSPSQVLVAKADTVKGFRQAMNLKTSKKLVSGQIRIALYGEETAKKGLIRFMDSISRDPKIGTMLFLAVAKGTANDILSYPYKDIENIGLYINETLEQNINGEQIVSSTLHEVINDYHTDGQDFVLPYLIREKDKVNIEGLAIFQMDKMIGTMKPREGFYLKILRDRFDAGELELVLPSKELKKSVKGIEIPKKININIDNIRSTSKIELVNKEKPEFDINIKLTLNIQEISEEIDLNKPETMKILTKLINEAFEKESNTLIRKLQLLQTDPIGLGCLYNHSIRDKKLTSEKWYPLYKNAKINVHFHTKIMGAGVMD